MSDIKNVHDHDHGSSNSSSSSNPSPQVKRSFTFAESNSVAAYDNVQRNDNVQRSQWLSRPSQFPPYLLMLLKLHQQPRPLRHTKTSWKDCSVVLTSPTCTCTRLEPNHPVTFHEEIDVSSTTWTKINRIPTLPWLLKFILLNWFGV